MEMTVEVDGDTVHSSRQLRSPMADDIVEMVREAASEGDEGDREAEA